MDQESALARLHLMVDAASDPVLHDTEVEDILRFAQRSDAAGNPCSNVATAPVWAAGTVYAYGDVVTAAPAAGRWWMCTTPGTSSTTQPTWADRSALPPYGATVADGTVVWTDVGTAWAPTWDLNAAAAEAWRIKAGRAAGRFNFTTDGQTFSRAQVAAGCRAQERSFRRKITGGI